MDVAGGCSRVACNIGKKCGQHCHGSLRVCFFGLIEMSCTIDSSRSRSRSLGSPYIPDAAQQNTNESPCLRSDVNSAGMAPASTAARQDAHPALSIARESTSAKAPAM